MPKKLDETRPSAGRRNDRKEWYEQVNQLKLEDGEYKNVRPVGGFLIMMRHWFKSKRGKNFAKFCPNWNPVTEKWEDNGCKACEYKDKYKGMFPQGCILFNCIDRDAQERGDSDEMAVACCPSGVEQELRRIMKLKKGIDPCHKSKGYDIALMYDPSQQGAKKWSVQKGDSSPLTDDERQLEQYDIDNICVAPPAEDIRDIVRMMKENDLLEELDEEDDDRSSKKGKNKQSNKKSREDDDDDEEEEKPRKKRKSLSDDDEDDGSSKKSKKRGRLSDDEEEEEEEAPKKKKKRSDDDDEDERPSKKRKSKSDYDEEDEEEEAPRKKKKSKRDSDDDDDDDPRKFKSKKRKQEDDDEEESDDEDEKPRKKSKKGRDDDDDEPKVKRGRFNDEDDEDEKPRNRSRGKSSKRKSKSDDDEEDEDDDSSGEDGRARTVKRNPEDINKKTKKPNCFGYYDGSKVCVGCPFMADCIDEVGVR